MTSRVLHAIFISAFCAALAGTQGAAIPVMVSASGKPAFAAAKEHEISEDDDSRKPSGEKSSQKKAKKTDLERAKEKAKKKLAKRKIPVSVKVDGTIWYFSKKGKLRAAKKGKKYYYLDGTAMTKADQMDFTTLLEAEKVAAKITSPSMSKRKKLSVCFHWVMKKYYGIHRSFGQKAGWPAVYAMDHFNNKNGDCHSDGAAFAYLAAACGYTSVYACLDSGKTTGNSHGWAEVNQKVYDPLFAQAKSFSRNYAASYRTYGLRAIVRVPIPYASTKSREASMKRYRFPGEKKPQKAKKKTSWKIRGWDIGKKHLLYTDGRRVTGTVYYKKKLYVFSEKGGLRDKKTADIRKAAKKNADASVLLALAGKPRKKSCSASCYGDGKDGLYQYRTFRITTFKPADGSTEIVMGIEGR